MRRIEQDGVETEQTGTGDESMRVAPLSVRPAFPEVTESLFADARDSGSLERSYWGGAPQSAAPGAAFLRASQFNEKSPDLCEQSWRDETVAEELRQTRQRRWPGIGPFIDIVL